MRGLRSFAGIILLGAASLGFASPGMISASQNIPALAPRLPAKIQRAVKRYKFAEPDAGRRRSKNPPTKRKLRANRLIISKRVRRKHRRAA